MSRVERVLLLGALLPALLIAWRIGALGVNDVPLGGDPSRTASRYAGDPALNIEYARDQLAIGKPAGAATIARAVLARSPLQAGALVILARTAEATHAVDARRLFAIALTRAPRNQYARAWMIGTELQEGEYAPAVANINTLLLFAPPRSAIFLPIMAQYAEKPKFAAALVAILGRHPPWRVTLLEYLLRFGSHAAVNAIYGGLQDAGDLAGNETRAWLQRLMDAKLWGEAYSRWVGGLDADARANLGNVFNGGFERPVTNIGFDWDVRGAPGALVERVRGNRGHVAQVTFLGRRVPVIRFGQTLVLAPGAYRLTFAASARALRSDRGIAWTLTCLDGGGQIAASAPLQGNFGWRRFSVDFAVPESGCAAQQLALANPGLAGRGKIVAGKLWFDDIAIKAMPATAARPAAPGS